MWNYRMIKVAQEGDKEIGMLAEIYYDDDGKPEGFCKANLMSLEDMKLASEDVLSQTQLDTHFYDTGVFSFDPANNSWDYKPH